MNVVFFHTPLGDPAKDAMYDTLARMLVENIRFFGYTPWHLTLEDGPDYGCHRIEVPGDKTEIMFARMRGYETFVRLYGEAWFLDTDAVINNPLPIPAEDALLTWRTMKDCYNGGVLFVRNPAFLALCLELYPGHQKDWWGDQAALKSAMGGDKPPGKYRVKGMIVKVVDCFTWNYTPEQHEKPEDLQDKLIIHFKGPRKQWLLT